MKLGAGFRLFLVLVLIIFLSFGLDWPQDKGRDGLVAGGIKKMKINNLVLLVPEAALWLPPQLVGSDIWSKDGYLSDYEGANYSAISIRVCWVLDKGVVVASDRSSGIECEKYGAVTSVIRFGLEAKPSGYTESMMERIAYGRINKRVWGYPDGLSYKEWFSDALDVGFMRLADKSGGFVSDRDLWNVAVSFSDGSYVECPIFAITDGFSGSCNQLFIWNKNDIVVSLYYNGVMVRYKNIIRRDVLIFLDKISLNGIG